ncbi:hypothetical protein T484DRAFT_3367646 [Baffinella frigidus]|nr:hypothetical protein T484DRAFT_3367646 [Cryptophyta sp. CCMP2293]
MRVSAGAVCLALAALAPRPSATFSHVSIAQLSNAPHLSAASCASCLAAPRSRPALAGARSPAPRCRRVEGQTRMTASGAEGSPILVVGATGAVGREVVRELLADGQRVRAMTRDPRGARALSLSKLPHAEALLEIVSGDVCQFNATVAAMAGCGACVSCQWTERPSSPKDIVFKMWDPSNEFLGAWGPTKPDPIPEEWGEDYSWLDPGTDARHPYNTVFAAACNLVDAARATGCARLVRAASPLAPLLAVSPQVVAHNAKWSMSVKWHKKGELVLEEAAYSEEVGEIALVRLADPLSPAPEEVTALAACAMLGTPAAGGEWLPGRALAEGEGGGEARVFDEGPHTQVMFLLIVSALFSPLIFTQLSGRMTVRSWATLAEVPLLSAWVLVFAQQLFTRATTGPGTGEIDLADVSRTFFPPEGSVEPEGSAVDALGKRGKREVDE